MDQEPDQQQELQEELLPELQEELQPEFEEELQPELQPASSTESSKLELSKCSNMFGSFRKRLELMAQLPHVAKLCRIFDLYDLDGIGSIEQSHVAECLRAMGLEPMESKLRTCIAEVAESTALGQCDENGPQRISFELLLTAYCALADLGQMRSAEDILSMLRSRDVGQTGSLPWSQLARLLTNLGDRLTERQVTALLQSGADAHGNVEYEPLVRVMTAADEELQPKLHQVRIYLNALGRSTPFLTTPQRDELLVQLRRQCDKEDADLVSMEVLLKVLNDSGQQFSVEELRVRSSEMTDEQGRIHYGKFLCALLDSSSLEGADA